MKRRLALALVLVAALVLWAVPVGAANPTVTITMSAEVVSITNTHDTWAIGTVTTSQTVYFSADNNQDDDYSQIENTGNVAVDVQIQGTDMEGGSYDLTLASAAGSEQYSLYCNNETQPTSYTIEVKSSAYNDICSNLPATGSDTCDWSMKLDTPTAYNANDDGSQKTATVTLVASKHT